MFKQIASSMLNRTQVRGKRIMARVKRFHYFARPLVTEQQYNAAKESGELEKYKYKEVQWAPYNLESSVFHDDEINRTINEIMRGGRKETARRVLHLAFYEMKCLQIPKARRLEAKKERQASEGKTGSDKIDDKVKVESNPLVIFHKALENCKPLVITRPVKRGGATYQVPFPVVPKQSDWFSLKWLISTCKDRPRPKKKQLWEALAYEFIDASNNEGKVVRKKDDIHRLADTNKAYSHYRWG